MGPEPKTIKLRFLIDECLTPALTDLAKQRGHVARHVSRIKELKGKSDRRVTHHALQYNMIVVTNNLVDFEEIYQKKHQHPGLIFLSAEGNLINREAHIQMFEAALDEIEEESPEGEAIHVHLEKDNGGDLQMVLERYPLP